MYSRMSAKRHEDQTPYRRTSGNDSSRLGCNCIAAGASGVSRSRSDRGQGEFVVNSVGASPKFTVKYMNDLLQVAADAHGGLARWNQLKMVKASVSITGAIWQLKGKPDALKDISIEAELHKERLMTHFNGQGLCTVFDP